jgi:hypothetical protein
VVSPVSNPLVAIYSAPPCETPGGIRVRFRPVGDQDWTLTPFKACAGAKSINFYVAGMRADTTYVMRHEGIVASTFVAGPSLFFQTGEFTLPAGFITVVPDPPDIESSMAEPVLLLSYFDPVKRIRFPIATNVEGEVIWFYEPLANGTEFGTLIRPLKGGNMTLLLSDGNPSAQRLVEIDLAGNTVRETKHDQGERAACGSRRG